MKRWKSPQAAAKLAERTAKKAKEVRREKRNCYLMIGAWAVITIGLMVGDYFWLKARAQRRREAHQQLLNQKPSASSATVTNFDLLKRTANSPKKD